MVLPYYADGSPALAFTDQQSKDSLLTVIGEGQKANEIVFVNRSFNDLVIDLAKAEGEAKGKGLTSQKPILVKLDKKGKGKFKFKDSGVYEFWIKNTENFARLFKDLGLEVSIDGEELKGWAGREDDKWIKVGEFDWLQGQHKIEVKSEKLKVKSFNREKFKELFQEMEFVIVSKERHKEYENMLKSKDIGYLFYIDKEKVEAMLKNDEKLKEIKFKKDNPFRIGEQGFYIPKDGNYSLKALVKPKRDFIEKGFISSSSSSIEALLDAFSGWDVKALNTTYKQNISEDGMHINAYFQNKGDVKEGVVLTKKFPDIRVKERPYLVFSCEMEDLGVQEVEIDVELVNESEWFSLFWTKKIRLKADNKQYVINLYQKANDIFGKETAPKLSISEISLKFKKKDGVDLSWEGDRHVYPFKFKNIAFLKTPPILADFKDRLFAYLPDNYYYFDANGDLRSVDFPEQIPWDIKDVYRLHLNRFIDLKETPVLSLNFSKPSMEDRREAWMFEDGKWRTEFPQEWKVMLGFDFDGDEKEDERVEMFVPAAGMSGGDLLLTVRAYEEVKKKFPDKQNYNLLSIGVSHPDDKEIVYQTVMSKKLIRYREYIYKPSDFMVGDNLLEIDGEIYKLPKVKDQEDNWIEFNNIYLKEGKHALNVFEDDRFKVDMVEIKSEVRSQKSEMGEDFQIVLEFKPQRLFEIGLLVSGITLLGCVGYIGYDFRKRRQLKRRDLK
ncbi:MAG: hypothetical protein HY752_07475 [Nitrospirae bacterium]|nr:hypothetical protein [Nitrospirota bacterium]